MKKTILKIAYIVLFLLALAVPGIYTLFQDKESIGNEETKEMKTANYLTFPEAFDSFFSANFGFRNDLITLNNKMKYNLFNQSGEKSVIVGNSGFLFYESALHDYTGEDILSAGQIGKITKILEITNDYAVKKGSRLVFTVAPNKMEVYSEYMPYYLKKDTNDGNYEMLIDALKNTNVKFTDLKNVLINSKSIEDTILYHKLDSHWNNFGAAIAYEDIMQAADMNYTKYSDYQYSVRRDFKGDLYAMLFPEDKDKDNQVYFKGSNDYDYVTNYKGNDDQYIETAGEGQNGDVYLFRDSFGNALYQYFSGDFQKAQVSRAVPYDMETAAGNSLIVLEIVERNIKNLLINPPVLPAIVTAVDSDWKDCGQITPEIKKAGDNYLLTIDSDYISETCVNVRLSIDGTVYIAYPSAKDGDACLYVPNDILSDGEHEYTLYIK